MTFAEKCLFVRTELLLTQVQLAKLLDVSQVTIARWESEESKPQTVQYGKFLKLCKKHNIVFDDNGGKQ